MDQGLFSGQSELRARAMFVGHRIDLRAFEHTQRLATGPLMVSAGAGGCVVLFRYGVVVLFGLDAVEQVNFMAGIEGLVVEPFDQAETEEIDLVLDPGQSEGMEQLRLRLQDFTMPRLQLVASVLAKSAVLTRYENNIAESFDHIEPLAARLRRGGRGLGRGGDLLRHIGDTLITHGRMVGRVEISEKPDLLWEHPELERLYAKLEDEYELGERHLALERKLDLIMRTAETLLDLLQNRRSLRVEWYIVILIVVEIVLTLYQMHF
jgi:required for meiotic nuclear division protein 1